MLKSKPNYAKLKTNLRLASNRLKMLEKKKSELTVKSRKEISDYIRAGKDDRARVRVEQVIREDFLVEGMEIVEMLCDMLLARFGVLEKIAFLDPSIEEAVATVVWSEPYLSSDVPELHEVARNLVHKYGKELGDSWRGNVMGTVNKKLLMKLRLHAPPAVLVENYMMEIAKSFGIPFTPDAAIMLGNAPEMSTVELVDISSNAYSRRPGSSDTCGGCDNSCGLGRTTTGSGAPYNATCPVPSLPLLPSAPHPQRHVNLPSFSVGATSLLTTPFQRPRNISSNASCSGKPTWPVTALLEHGLPPAFKGDCYIGIGSPADHDYAELSFADLPHQVPRSSCTDNELSPVPLTNDLTLSVHVSDNAYAGCSGDPPISSILRTPNDCDNLYFVVEPFGDSYEAAAYASAESRATADDCWADAHVYERLSLDSERTATYAALRNDIDDLSTRLSALKDK